MDQIDIAETKRLSEGIHLRKPDRENNAYGTICFDGFDSKASKNAPYVLVSVPEVGIDEKAQQDARKVWELMQGGWKVPSPNLIISVTGGAQNFYLNERLLNGFKRGLISLATTAAAWIITGGTKTGVMEMVGEAAREHTLKNNLPKQNIVLLGVVDWNMVANNQCLISTAKPDVLYECHYKNDKKTAPGNQQQQPTAATDSLANAATVAAGEHNSKQSFLDPNHTHFVLVDNGTDGYGGEIEFRAHLEKQIAEHAYGSDGEGLRVPTVLLVLEGGQGTLKTVCETIKKNIPVVVIAGSGRAANLIAYALENKDRWKTTGKEKTAEILDIKTDDVVDSCINYVDDLLKLEYQKLLVVYRQTDEDIQHDIDVAVIKALIGAPRDVIRKSDVASQLNLALAWNRADIAETEILNVRKRKEWKDMMYPVLLEALIQDKDKFVLALLDTGVDLGEFLTREKLQTLCQEVLTRKRLESLYQDVSGISINLLKGLLNNSKKRCCHGNGFCGRNSVAAADFNLEDYGELIKDLTNDYRPNMYRDVKEIKSPERHLFLWALLLKRKNLALTFWRLGSDHVGGALFASMLSKSMAEVADQEDELDLADQFRADASEYEALATGILDECYKKNKETSHRLLTRNLDRWGNRTLFVLANDSELMDFMETSCCQTLLNETWMGRMALSTPMWKILLSLILPVVCLTIVYTDPEDKNEATPNAYKPADDGNTIETPSKPAANGSIDGIVKQDTNEVNDGKRSKGYSMKWANYCNAFYFYYTAPIVNFCYFTIAYLVFLGLFSFFVLTDLVPDNPSVYEYIVWGWALTMFMEEIRQFFNEESQTFKKKLKAYYRSYWHRLDLVVYVLFVISVILRYTLPASTFVWAQMFYVSTLSLYFIRFLQLFYVEKNIGPKVLAIQRMLYDLAFFLLILAVFLLAFGVGSQALLYPNSPATWSILYNVVSGPYFDIFGNINMDEYLGQVAGCSYNATVYENDPSIPQCSVENALAYIMLAIYILLVNILLINLLIAMFSYTFSNVQENAGKVWRFYRCELVNEYFDKPPLPPPLIVISHTWMLVKFLYRKYKAYKEVKSGNNPKQVKTDFKQYLDKDENEFLTAFERDSMELYFIKQRRGEQNQTDYKMNVASQNDCNDTRARLEKLEKQMSQQFHLLQRVHTQLDGISQLLVAAPAHNAQIHRTVENVEIRNLDTGSSTS